MRLLSHLLPSPELQPVEPFNGPVQDYRARAVRAGALLHALGGPAAVLARADDAWDPSADEEIGGFDIHLGVYTSD